MKFDLQLHSNEDLEYFKVLFLRNIGDEQTLYHFHADNMQVRIQVSGLSGYQLVSVGFFDCIKEGATTSINQFCPLADSRYKNYDVIQDFWYYDSSKAWGSFSHAPEEVEWALEKVADILRIVYKVNNLKAFL
jgi:hypothetical protein